MLDNNSKFNTEKLKRSIEQLLKEHDIKFELKEDSRGTVYTVRGSDAVLTITVGESWVGYDLKIDRSVLGKTIGISQDTDLYPLGGENLDITQSIADEVLAILKGLLSETIYVGFSKGKPTLAVPVDGGNYEFIVRGKFTGKRYKASKEELGRLTNTQTIKH